MHVNTLCPLHWTTQTTQLIQRKGVEHSNQEIFIYPRKHFLKRSTVSGTGGIRCLLTPRRFTCPSRTRLTALGPWRPTHLSRAVFAGRTEGTYRAALVQGDGRKVNPLKDVFVSHTLIDTIFIKNYLKRKPWFYFRISKKNTLKRTLLEDPSWRFGGGPSKEL